MAGTVLVAYATRAGSTAEVAEFVGKTLRERGMNVDVRPAKDVKDISRYGAVVLGSAVRVGQVLPEVVKFAEQHQDALRRIPAAYFAVCFTMSEDSPEHRATASGYLQPLRAVREPVSEGLFAGKVDFSKIGLLWRFMLRANKEVHLPEGDFRDWDAIRAWTDELLPALAHPQPA